MNKPDFSKCETSEHYYSKLALYWEYRYHCAKSVGDACLERFVELEEVYWDEDGLPCWVSDGNLVGGA